MFHLLFGGQQANQEQEVAEALRKAMDDWQPSQDSPLSWALFPSVHREAWVDLFYKVQHPSPYLWGCGEAFQQSGEHPQSH